jgi:hypothetical protein
MVLVQGATLKDTKAGVKYQVPEFVLLVQCLCRTLIRIHRQDADKARRRSTRLSGALSTPTPCPRTCNTSCNLSISPDKSGDLSASQLNWERVANDRPKDSRLSKARPNANWSKSTSYRRTTRPRSVPNKRRKAKRVQERGPANYKRAIYKGDYMCSHALAIIESKLILIAVKEFHSPDESISNMAMQIMNDFINGQSDRPEQG